jgi:CRP-like cAMP-binding protein
MRCPKCGADIPEHVEECAACGHSVADAKEHNGSGRAAAHFSGFRRTLSTELMEREMRECLLEECNELFDSRTYDAGKTIIQQGEKNRDLIFVTEGLLDISTEGDGEEVMLSRVEGPYILGDIGFLSGFPRTATVKAETTVKAFVLNYENFSACFPDMPDWFRPLLTSFVSGIKSLLYENAQLKKEMRTP